MKGVHSYATHFTFMLDMLDYDMQVELHIGTLAITKALERAN